ncbi:MAG: transcriptional regulator [Pseudomonadota bacterium]
MSKYHYTESGPDNVWLLDGYTIHQIDGEEAVSINDMDNLHKAIGKVIATSQNKISPKEIRFLRVEMGLSQKNLAACLGVEAQTIARWEKNECAIPGPAERLLRAFYLEHNDGNTDIVELCNKFAELDEMESACKREFEHNENGWKLAA